MRKLLIALTLTTSSTTIASPTPADTCLGAMRTEFQRRRVDFDAITSVHNVHLRLEVFGQACATQFPTYAAAATRASKAGVTERRRIFATLLSSDCPTLGGLKSGSDVVASCASFTGTLWTGAAPRFLSRVDAGTFAFSTLLRKNGLGGFGEELALQASFHPELDP